MIAYVLPTRDRPRCLARTLDALGALPPHDAEVLVADNASCPPPAVPVELPNGLSVTLLLRARNEGAAARNAAVLAADDRREWIVMLDDDSHPLNLDFLGALREQPPGVAAVCAECFLPYSATTSLFRRESGGLPEVPVGCAVAYRRRAFLDAAIAGTAGYDPSFCFYAEEYDLAARLIRAGHRIVLDRRFVVLHEKTPAGRSMDTILRSLVRNNAWVMRRYAPRAERSAEIRRTIARYARIAVKERALAGYLAGLAQLVPSLHRQPDLELSPEHWDRFTGMAACRRSLLRCRSERRFSSAAIVAPGKNEHVVRQCLRDIGVRVSADEREAEALVIGTLSPGPMLDALDALRDDPRVVAPWSEAAEPITRPRPLSIHSPAEDAA
jgi:GT2 family glycosyltransferase